MQYDNSKIYIGLIFTVPHIMIGNSLEKHFSFRMISGKIPTEQSFTEPFKTGQECLDYHINRGMPIKEFSDARSALTYMLSFM
jgi:hypothetical protein